MKKLFVLLALLFFSLGTGTSISIGTAPGSLNLGTVSQGSTVQQDIYIVSNDIEQNFTVNPSANAVSARSLFDGGFENKGEISEQEGTEWWSFERVRINPSTDVPRSQIEDSSVPTVQGVAEATLNIPEDAEPGYRYGTIRLNTDLGEAEGSGSGARIVTPTRLSYSFRVPGEVRRDIVVRDVRAFRLGENRAAVEVLLSNEGTVTTSVDSFNAEVLDSGRDRETGLLVGGATLAPGESQWVDASWSSDNPIEEGSYQLDGQIDYFTGQATASGSFSLPDFEVVEVRPEDSPGSDQDQQRDPVPMWLVFMVLAVLAVLMWSFDIEPFWILAITGGLAISAFILLSGVSNYLLMVLLMAVGIVFYGVM